MSASVGGKEGIWGGLTSGNVCIFRNLQAGCRLITLVMMYRLGEKWNMRRLAWPSLCLVVMCIHALAQEGDDASFKAVKEKFAAEREKKLAPQVARYIRKLAEIEARCAEQRDYALAAKVQAEYRKAVDQWYKLSGEKRGTIRLKPGDAKLAGGVTFDKKSGLLQGWGKAGAKAVWTLPPGIQAGAYSIAVEYSCKGKAIEIVFSDGHYLLPRKFTDSEGEIKNQSFTALLLKADGENFSIECAENSEVELQVKAVKLQQLKAR